MWYNKGKVTTQESTLVSVSDGKVRRPSLGLKVRVRAFFLGGGGGWKFSGGLIRERVDKKPVYVVVQFYPWFNFYFPLFYTHYHALSYTKTKENKN